MQSCGRSAVVFRVEDCLLLRCSSDGAGGGVSLNSGTVFVQVLMQNTQIRDCVAGRSGGGLAVIGRSATGMLTDCVVSSCRAIMVGGGALFVSDYAQATLERSTIAVCYSGAEGGGIYVSGSEVIVHNSTITACRAREGGGLYQVSLNTGGSGCKVRLEGTDISLCTAAEAGGGVLLESGVLVMAGQTTLRRNVAPRGRNIDARGGEPAHVLPTVPAHWVPARKCKVPRSHRIRAHHCWPHTIASRRRPRRG
jgi:hypothetical protein